MSRDPVNLIQPISRILYLLFTSCDQTNWPTTAMSEKDARGPAPPLASSNDVTFGVQNLPTLTAPSRATATPAVLSNENASNDSPSTPVVNAASADSAVLQLSNVSLPKKNTTANIQAGSQRQDGFIHRPAGGPGAPTAAPHENLSSDPVSMIPLLQSRSSEADAFQKLLKKYLIGQVML